MPIKDTTLARQPLSADRGRLGKKKDARMHKERAKKELKKQLGSLFKSMDFVSSNFLDSEKMGRKEFQIFFNIYQQLGLAWEFLGLQCKHWDGYKKTKDKKETCKICGKVKGADDFYILLTRKGPYVREGNVECSIDDHVIHVRLHDEDRNRGGKRYGGFPWEIRKKHLKHFPVIFDFDEKYRFLGLTILK
jgi:hypothetical protein